MGIGCLLNKKDTTAAEIRTYTEEIKDAAVQMVKELKMSTPRRRRDSAFRPTRYVDGSRLPTAGARVPRPAPRVTARPFRTPSSSLTEGNPGVASEMEGPTPS